MGELYALRGDGLQQGMAGWEHLPRDAQARLGELRNCTKPWAPQPCCSAHHQGPGGCCYLARLRLLVPSRHIHVESGCPHECGVGDGPHSVSLPVGGGCDRPVDGVLCRHQAHRSALPPEARRCAHDPRAEAAARAATPLPGPRAHRARTSTAYLLITAFMLPVRRVEPSAADLLSEAWPA